LIVDLSAVDASLGNGQKRPTEAEGQARLLGRRSIVAAVDIQMHEIIHTHMLTYKRPAGGLDPREVDRVIGMQSRRNLAKDSILRWEDLMPSLSMEDAALLISNAPVKARPQPGGSNA
jgi:N-acetylneuraminate synthase